VIVVDADFLGRARTGDETYVRNLLRALPRVAPDLRFAALTRRPDLVPDGVEPIHVPARLQELRMAVRLPLLLRRLRPELVHFVHALPPALPCPGVLTVQDLSFERDASLMGLRETLTFRLAVRPSVRRARRVFAISERTRADLVELYGVREEDVVVTPLAADEAFVPGDAPREDYVLLVGSVEQRKRPLVAADAALACGRRLVVAGPERDPELVEELRRRGADLRGYVEQDELVRLYQRAAVVLVPTSYEGFGLTVAEAMACGAPVIAAPDPAVREVGGDAVAYAEPPEFSETLAAVLADAEGRSAAALERARAFSWERTAERTAAVYREVLG
jgi:glycosyltransferase involved in cell wall biosynthesis